MANNNQVRITQVALDFILHAAKNTYPSEFAGLLRKNKQGVISEVLVIPQTTYGERFSSINLNNLTWSSNHCGSVHSHPGTSAHPSSADLNFFRVTGDTHIIVAYPFTSNSMRAYDAKGNELQLLIDAQNE